MNGHLSKPRRERESGKTKNAEPARAARSSSRRHVFLALDDVFTSMILAKYLRQKGWQVVVAGAMSREEAPKQLARRNHWHALIADAGPAGGLVLNALERPKRHGVSLRVDRKILLGDISRARRDRDTRRLDKPVSPRALREALDLPEPSSSQR